MSTLSININDTVSVALTAYGAGELNKVLKIDTYKEAITYRAQIHALFYIFSPILLYAGKEPLFKDDIISFNMNENEVIINMNTFIEVTLTESGANIINNYNNQFNYNITEYSKKIRKKVLKEYILKNDYKENDVYKSKLCDIILIFGPRLFNGCTSPFVKNNIKIEVN